MPTMAGHDAAQRTGRPRGGNQPVTSAQESTRYERVGGSAWFTALVERDAWYGHLADAVRAGGLDAGDEAEMLDYFAMAATHLINTG